MDTLPSRKQEACSTTTTSTIGPPRLPRVHLCRGAQVPITVQGPSRAQVGAAPLPLGHDHAASMDLRSADLQAPAQHRSEFLS